MNIFITGSTGVLGRRLVRQFVARGHAVVGVVRSQDGEKLVSALGGTPRWADLFDVNSLVHAAERADVVIHAATAIPTKARTTAQDWQLNDRIRRQGTQALVDCAARVGAKTFIYQSVVWVACPRDGSTFDEESPTDPDPTIRSAVDGERIAQQAAAVHGFSASVLRCGWFYSADSAHTVMFARELSRRRLPIIGKGDAVWCCLHADDAASAFVAAAEAGKAGLWHVTDNQPVMARDFLRAFAKRLSAPPPRRLPVWLIKFIAGKAAVDFLTRSIRTGNARFCRDFDWSPQFPGYLEGLDQVVAAMRERE